MANAGVAPVQGTLRTMDPTEYDRVIAVNQVGVFNTVRPAIEPVIATKGHIHVVASVAAFSPGLGASPYMISKVATEQLGRAAAARARRPRGQRVAYFGIVETAMTRGAFDEDPGGRDALKLMPAPLRRRITPEHAARVIVNGVGRRAGRTLAPGAWWAALLTRGVGDVLLDAGIRRDRRVHALIRASEERASRASRSTPSSGSPTPPADPGAARAPARPAGSSRS